MKHVVVVHEIEDDATLEDILPKSPKVKYIGMTPGITMRQLSTGEDAFIPYACWFDMDSSRMFASNEEYNWMLLRVQQTWANDMLRARGHLLLNDVHDALGLRRTRMGAVVGWDYETRQESDPTRPNFVDFGCWAQETDPIGNGKTGSILLMFNVQGPVLHAIR
jgi:hypothetical protein